MSIEDSMNLNSQMAKKEKEFLQFIRQKLDSKKNLIGNTSENFDGEENLTGLSKANTTDKKNTKDTKPKIDQKMNKEDTSPNGKVFNMNNITTLLTKKEMDFTTCFNITCMSGQKEINKYNNLLGIGMIDGSILVWDCELHTDKFLFQKNSRFEITSISIDENYLICGSIKGQIYVYDLIVGKEIFTCAHDPYTVTSIQKFLSFFPFMNMGFDSNDKIFIYNSKECHKIGKLMLNSEESNEGNYYICFYNQFLCDYNHKYLVLVCEKRTKEETKDNGQKNILDLINFSKERIEILRNKPKEKITSFFNLKNNEINSRVIIQVEETNKSNISQDKNEQNNQKPLTVNNPKNNQKDDKKGKNKKVNEQIANQEEQQVVEPITKLDFRENVIIIYRTLDILFKCYPNLNLSYKKGISLKKVMKKYRYDEYPTYNANESRKEGIQYLSSDLFSENKEGGKEKLLKDLNQVKELKEGNKIQESKEKEKYNSTQRKDIFYNSFKNIKERHKFREERINKLQEQKKRIENDLKKKNKIKKK
jgi:hypothetical protein